MRSFGGVLTEPLLDLAFVLALAENDNRCLANLHSGVDLPARARVVGCDCGCDCGLGIETGTGCACCAWI